MELLFNKLSALVQSLLSVLKILIRSNLFLKNYKINKDACFILGNGPSLNPILKDHTASLKASTLFCVNGFSTTPFFTQLQPQYYVINAPEFWSGDSGIHGFSIIQSMIDSIIEKTNWPMTIFLPVRSKQNKIFIRKLQSNTNLSLSFFNTTPAEGLTSWNFFFYSKGWGSPRQHNVLIPSILLAINAGIRKIYLIGADHSWLPLISVNDQNQALVNQKHFYDEKTQKDKPMYKLGKRPRRLHEILEKFMLAFKAYFVLDAYAQTKKANIINCTPGSFIDAFDRQAIKNIFLQ